MISDYQNSHNTIKSKDQLSIVIPAYNEEGNLQKLFEELMKVLPLLHLSWEIIICDDGSKDGTWKEIEALHRKNEHVKGIRLSRNFGQQYALFAGLSKARGDAVISLDADLQHPPNLIPEIISEWQKGNKIVHTIRIDPEDINWFKKLTSKIFYKLFSFLSGVNIESGMADFRLLDRKVVDSILQFREEGLFLRGIVQTVGYSSTKIFYQCKERFRGNSKYTFKKMVKFAWTGISSFSTIPLRISIYVGLLTSIISFGELTYAVFVKIFTESAVPGWASAVSIVSFLLGILFILLGFIGEYIGRILIEVRNRPRYLISEQVGLEVSS